MDEIWTPRPATRADIRRIEEKERELRQPFFGIGKFAVRDEDGSISWESEWEGNNYGNDGKAEALNVMYRAIARTGTYCLGLATNATLADTTAMSAVTEPTDGGYGRQTLTPGTWSAPSDPGDGNRQISYPQLTFGPAQATWPINYVFGTTATTGTAGLFLFYLAAVFSLSSGQSFLYTLSQKTRSS